MPLPSTLTHLCDTLLPLEDPQRTLVSGTQSAVLLLLYPHEDRIHFALTRRPETLNRHAGQISLPGGVREAADPTLLATALRETYEEIGLTPECVLPLGRLSSYQLNVTGYLIHPFVGWTDSRPCFIPSPHEVAEVIEVPLERLLDPGVVLEEIWEVRNGRRLVTFYRFGSDNVWGATATILGDFAQRFESSLRWPSSPPGSVRPIP